jgi:hypothetical protein
MEHPSMPAAKKTAKQDAEQRLLRSRCSYYPGDDGTIANSILSGGGINYLVKGFGDRGNLYQV